MVEISLTFRSSYAVFQDTDTITSLIYKHMVLNKMYKRQRSQNHIDQEKKELKPKQTPSSQDV